MKFDKNIHLLIRLLTTWRVATLLVGTILVFLNVCDLSQRYELTISEIGIATIGMIAGFIFLKASWLLMFYRLVFKSKFDGSCLIMAALVSVFWEVSLVSVAYIGSSRASDYPYAAMPWLLAFAYVFFTLVLSLTFKAANWLFKKGC